MIGSELRGWRKCNHFAQDMLRCALGGSRQDIICWEKSDDKIPPMAELALLALEHVPGCQNIDGHRYSVQ